MPEPEPGSLVIRAEGVGGVAAHTIQQGAAIATGAGAVALAGDYVLLQSVELSPDSVYTRVALDRFVGREWLEQRVNTFLAAHDRGVFILEAGAGLGKTSFLAHLARARGWCQHFVETAPGVSGVETGLLNLAAQLVRQWELAPYFEAKSLPGRAGRPGFLTTLLSSAATKRDATQPGKPIVLVVDALDESFAPEGQNVLGLPRTLPNGVYLIVSQRPVRVTLNVGGITPEVIRLEADAANNRDDMVRFLSAAAQRPAIAAVLQRCAVTPAEFAEALAQRCRGVWIYLQYVITEIEAGNRDPLVLEELPKGVWQYYAEFWQRWRARPDWTTVHLPLIVSLAAAQEDVSLAQLVDFSGGLNASTVRELLEGPWRPFITVVPPTAPDGVARYRCYHASLREFLDGRVETQGFTSEHKIVAQELAEATRAAHTRIARRFLDTWGGLPAGLPALQAGKPSLTPDDYGLRHLVAHLAAGEDTRLLKDLLTAEWSERVERTVRRVGWRGWLDRMRRRPHVVHDTRFHNAWFTVKSTRGDLAGYLRDLDRSARAASNRSRAFLAAGQPAPSIVLEARCALMRASVRALVGNLGPNLLEALVAQSLLSPAEGRAYAEQSPNDPQRLVALLRVAPYLAEPGRTETFRSALATWHELERHEILEIVPRLPTAIPEWVWLELLRALEQRFAHESHVLDGVLAKMAERVPVTLCAELRRLAKTLESRGIPILAVLTKRFQQEDTTLRAELGSRIEQLFAERSNPSFDLLLPCASFLSAEQRSAALASARAELRDSYPYPGLIVLLLEASDARLRDQIAEEVFAALRKLRPSQLVHEAGPILHRLPSSALAEIQQVVRETPDAGLERQLRLYEIRYQFARGDNAAARAAADALSSPNPPYYPDYHGRALAALAEHANADQLKALIEEIFALTSSSARLLALDALAPRMNRATLARALAQSREIDDRFDSERALLELLKQAAQSSPGPRLLDATTKVTWYPGQALAAVVPGLSPEQLKIAESRAASIELPAERALALAALAAAGDAGAGSARLTEAIELATSLTEPSPRVALLTALLRDSPIRHALAPRQRAELIAPLFADCRQLVRKSETVYDVERALEQLAPILTPIERTRALGLIGNLDEHHRQQSLLRTLLRGREDSALERWLTCEQLGTLDHRRRTGDPIALRKKLEAARSISPVQKRVAALCVLLPDLTGHLDPDPEHVLRSALLAALSLDLPAERDAALQVIRPHVNFFGQRAIDAALRPLAPIVSPTKAWEDFSALLLAAGASPTPTEIIAAPASDPEPAQLFNRLISLRGILHEAAWLALAESLAPDDVERVVGSAVFYRLTEADRVVPVLRVRTSPALLAAIQSNIRHPPVHGDDRGYKWIEVLPLLPEATIAEGLRRWSDSVRMEERDQWIRALQTKLEAEHPSHVHQRWNEILSFTTDRARERLYHDLGTLSPLAARLGGPDAVLSLITAVHQTARWWP
jgi:hypothetical protein